MFQFVNEQTMWYPCSFSFSVLKCESAYRFYLFIYLFFYDGGSSCIFVVVNNPTEIHFMKLVVEVMQPS